MIVFTTWRAAGESLAIGEDLELVVLSVAEHDVQLKILERVDDQEPVSVVVRLTRFRPQYLGKGTLVTVMSVGRDGRVLLQVQSPAQFFPSQQQEEQSPEQKYGPGYPESEKVFELQPKYQVISEFIGWLQQHEGLVFCRRMDGMMTMVHPSGQENTMQAAYLPQLVQTENWLHEFFGVDRHELTREQLQMRDALRNVQKSV